MKLWILRPVEDLPYDKDPWEPWYDKMFGAVVLAETEQEARQIEQAAKKLPSLPDADDVARMRGKKPRYRNEPITVDGETFASKKQYARWCQLKMMEQSGKVSNLRREVPFELAPSVTLDGKKKPAVRYFADAVYVEDGVAVIEDTKSPVTRRDPVYRIKKHLMKSVLGIEIREV